MTQPPPVHMYPGYPPPGLNAMAILAVVFLAVFPPLSMVFGHIARKQIQETGEQGASLATAGLIGGYVVTGLYLVGCLGFAVLFLATSTSL
jgi:hypothetical protein